MSKKLKTFTFIPSFLILIIAGSLISCKMSLFSKVEVKAAPNIYAPLGEKTLEIKEFVSLEKMENLIGTDNEALVFQYPQNQDGVAENENAPMTFMIYYPIMELPLNLGEYIEGIDLSSFNAAIPEVEFTAGIDVKPIEPLCITAEYYLAAGRHTIPLGIDEKMKNINELNLTCSYMFNDTFSLYARANNLLFQKYDLWYGMPAQGFNFMVGLNLNF